MSPKQIVQLLRSQVIPWTTSGARSGIIVAQTAIRSIDLPDGVTMTRQTIVGKRVVIKNKRKYGNQRLLVAKWPEANLQQMACPKIVSIVSGIADVLLGNGCVHCDPGTFILIPPLIPHHNEGPELQGERLRNGSCAVVEAIAHRNGVLFYYTLSFNGRQVNEFTDNYLIPSVTASQILHSLTDEATEEKAHLESVAAPLISAFFAIIAREIEAGNYMHPGPKDSNVLESARSTATFAEQVQEYLGTNCHRPLKLDSVAAHMYMSRSQFSRRMRQEIGITFVELLTRIRIEQACRMLRETDLTAAAISSHVSFKSSTHFQSLFRSRVGCTPMEYRRKNALEN